MSLSKVSKSVLGITATTGTLTAPYLTWKIYNLSIKDDYDFRIGQLDNIEYASLEIDNKDLRSHNYSNFFLNYACTQGLKEILNKNLISPSYRVQKPLLDLNNDDFFTDIQNTKSGCFYMKAEDTIEGNNNYFAGISELTVRTGKYAMIIQTQFKLKKSDVEDDKSYFQNQLSFLKKKNNVWKLDKAVAWEEKDIKNKKANEMFDDSNPQEILKRWEKNEKGTDSLLNKFEFKQETKFWKDVHVPSSFEQIMFWYLSKDNQDKRWHKNRPDKIKIKVSEGWDNNNIPKGTWIKLNLRDFKKDVLWQQSCDLWRNYIVRNSNVQCKKTTEMVRILDEERAKNWTEALKDEEFKKQYEKDCDKILWLLKKNSEQTGIENWKIIYKQEVSYDNEDKKKQIDKSQNQVAEKKV